jgi:hypothetical protein
VNGVIQNGPNGSFDVDIPLNSSRSFVHQGTLQASDLNIPVIRWPRNTDMSDLILEPVHLPEQHVRQYWVVRGRNVAQMKLADDKTRLVHMRSSDQRLDLRSQIQLQSLGYSSMDDLQNRWFNDGPQSSEEQSDKYPELVDRMVMPMIINRLGVLPTRRATSRRDDQPIHLFILARSPDSFKLRSNRLGQEDSYVVYHITLFKPGPTLLGEHDG